MGQKSNYAARKDAKIKLKKEECAKHMGRRSHAKYAARKDARIKLELEEFATGMVERSNDAVRRRHIAAVKVKVKVPPQLQRAVVVVQGKGIRPSRRNKKEW